MRNLTLAAAALLCSASALAQTPDTSPEPATHPHGSATTDTTAPGTVAEPPAPPSSAPTAPTTSAATSAPMASSGTVDLAAHDADQDGALSPLEFGQHVAAMKGDSALSAEARRERYSRASDNGAIKLLNASAADFSKADKNMDRRVDSTELAMWHSGDASASASAAPSAPITSGAGTMTTAPDTSATMTPSTPADEPPPSDTPLDDMQNSTEPKESTTIPPTIG